MKVLSNVQWCLSMVIKYKPLLLSHLSDTTFANEKIEIYEQLLLQILENVAQLEKLQPILADGILYLLLTEIILQEFPPTIQWYLASGGTHSEQTHLILLRWIKNRGLNLEELDSQPITPATLSCLDPFETTAHEYLVECLMEFYIQVSLTKENIFHAIQSMDPNFETEPFDLEDAFLLWIDQSCKVYDYKNGLASSIEQETKLVDLWKSLSDGTCIAKVILYYESEIVPVDYFLLGEHLSFEEKLENWSRIIDLCSDVLGIFASFPAKILSAASNEDTVYRSNLIVFLIDLFCSLVPPDDFEEDGKEQEQILPPKENIIQSIEVKKSDITELLPQTSISARSSSSVGGSSSEYKKNHNPYRNLFERESADVEQENPIVDQVRVVDSMESSTASTNSDSMIQANTTKSSQDQFLFVKKSSIAPTLSRYAPASEEFDEINAEGQDAIQKNDFSLNLQTVSDTSINCSKNSIILKGSKDDEDDSVITGESISQSLDFFNPIQSIQTAREHFVPLTQGITPRIKVDKSHDLYYKSKLLKEVLPSSLGTPISLKDISMLGTNNAASATKSVDLGLYDIVTKPSENLSDVVNDVQNISNLKIRASLSLPRKSIQDMERMRVSITQELEKVNTEEVKVEEKLKEIQKENQMLKLLLLEQKKQIEEERKLLVERLHVEKLKIQQETIRTFLEKQKSNLPTVRRSSFFEAAKTRFELIQIPAHEVIHKEQSKDYEKRVEKLNQIRQQKLEEESQRKTKKAEKAAITTLNATIFTNPAPTKAMKGQKSNKQIIKNAICHICLAGKVNEEKKNEVLNVLAENVTDSHFVLLVRDEKTPSFEGLYSMKSTNPVVGTTAAAAATASNSSSNSSKESGSNGEYELHLLTGKGPKLLLENHIKTFCRYDSGSKRFISLPTKHIGVTTDAVVLTSPFKKKKTKA